MPGNAHRYVHGYDERESERLDAQAWSVAELLHSETRYAPGERILEAGCATGAQTISLARNNPRSHIVAIDHSRTSLEEARARIASASIENVEFREADLYELPFAPHSFDHVFGCFVLEHLANPEEAVSVLRRVVRPGGTMIVFEGDHGSAYFHPQSVCADAVIACQVELQRRAGGNALIGRKLYPLLSSCGLSDVRVTPKMVYVDGSHPDLIESFTLGTFTAMMQGVRERAISDGLIGAETFDRGIGDLQRTAAIDGVFCYTFFRAKGTCGG